MKIFKSTIWRKIEAFLMTKKFLMTYSQPAETEIFLQVDIFTACGSKSVSAGWQTAETYSFCNVSAETELCKLACFCRFPTCRNILVAKTLHNFFSFAIQWWKSTLSSAKWSCNEIHISSNQKWKTWCNFASDMNCLIKSMGMKVILLTCMSNVQKYYFNWFLLDKLKFNFHSWFSLHICKIGYPTKH